MRCAETTRISNGTPSSCERRRARRASSPGRTSMPMMIPTSGLLHATPAFGPPEVRALDCEAARADAFSRSGSTIGRAAARCTCGSASTRARSPTICAASPRSGFDVVRFFLLWETSSPSRTGSTARCCARLERVMELIAAPRAARDADALLRAHERRELAAGWTLDRDTPERPLPHDRRDTATSPVRHAATSTPTALLRAQRLHAREVGAVLRGHPGALRLGSRQRVQQRARARVGRRRARVEQSG